MRKDTEEDVLDNDEERDESMATYDDYLRLKEEQDRDAADDDDEDQDDDSDDDSEESDDADDKPGDDDQDEADEDSDEGDDDSDDKDAPADKEGEEQDGDDKGADGEKPDADEVDPRTKLQIERAEARAEHAQQAHDALTGKYGKLVEDFRALQKRLEERESAQRKERGDDDYSHEYNDQERREIAELRRKVEELQSDRREAPVLTAEQVVLQEAHGFAQSARYKADCAKFEEPIKAALNKAIAPGAPLTEALDSGNHDKARLLIRDVLREAYYAAKDAELDRVAEENRKRKEKTSKDLKRKKRDAAPSGVGTRGKSKQDDFEIDPDALTNNPSLARDPKFIRALQRAGKRLGR